MNKKSAEYLRKQGYLVEENVYQDNSRPGTGSKIEKEAKPLTANEQLTKLEEMVFNSGCELLQKYQTWKDNYLTNLKEESKISDLELIEELRKRVNQQTIKLTIYPRQEHFLLPPKIPPKKLASLCRLKGRRNMPKYNHCSKCTKFLGWKNFFCFWTKNKPCPNCEENQL